MHTPDVRLGTRLALALAVVAGSGAIGGCDDDDETGPGTTQFVAALAASKEVEPPTPITSGATGTTTFTLAGGTVSYTIAVSGLSSNASAAHIHGPASATENAGVLVPLTPVAAVTSGTIASASFTAANMTPGTGVSFDSLLVLMRNGNAYVNVHTANHPAGEARGQVQTVP